MSTATLPASVKSRMPEYGIEIVCLASKKITPGHGCTFGYGRWIDLELTSNRADIEDAIEAIIINSPTREFHPDPIKFEGENIQGISGLPEFLFIYDNFDLDRVSTFMQTLRMFIGELDREAYPALCTYYEKVFTETEFRRRFQGVYASTAEFAQEYAFAIDHELGVLIFR